MRACAIASVFVLAFLANRATASSFEGAAHYGSYALDLVDEAGNALPTFQSGGRTYVLGALGRRYALRLRNGSGQRAEFVAAVDGRDVLDGRPSAFEKRGYIVQPYGEVVIDGFRLNSDSVAAFRFSDVRRSYAARMGDARDVGVIGVAVFPERPRVYVPPYAADVGRRSEGSAQPGESASALDEPQSGAPVPSAPSMNKSAEAKRSMSRPGLGTQFGEQRESRVQEIEFERASTRPEAVLILRYNDCQGLSAMGVDVSRCCSNRYDVGLRENSDPFRRDPPFSQPPPGWTGR